MISKWIIGIKRFTLFIVVVIVIRQFGEMYKLMQMCNSKKKEKKEEKKVRVEKFSVFKRCWVNIKSEGSSQL